MVKVNPDVATYPGYFLKGQACQENTARANRKGIV
jgi:hypothetical protein